MQNFNIIYFTGILKFYQEDLLEMDFIHLGQFLSKLPDDIPAASLFQAIASLNLMEQKFIQTLAMQKEVAAQIKSVSSSTKWKNMDKKLTVFNLTFLLWKYFLTGSFMQGRLTWL